MRRSSYGTRRGEVVIINSILNNRIPQLKTALEEGTCVNERDNQGKTPLYIAVEQNSLEAVEILVEAGAVINACCGSTYETTLHEAVRRKNLPIIEYLLSKGASMKIKNSAGNTAEELGKNDAKIRKVLEKFKNEHVLQPVIPPPKSKIHFVQLIDEKMIRESDKKKLPGKINLVSMDMATPTHLVVPVDLKTKVLNVTKDHLAEVLKAIVKSTMIVSREWLKACIIDPSRAEDDRNYAVKKVQWMDGPVYTNRIEEWKKTISKMQPKLFAGCKFYFSRPKYNFLDRVTLIELVRIADGQASAREPILDDKNPAPYHNSNLKPNFIVYSLTHDIGDKFRDCTKYNLVCEQWLIESILGCSISTPPY
uniref:ANK_REP_REGION domain-containing protein n=1 Tax=Caenorhabditis japonica TaxID=281687 RepID=A0A8R1E4U0_CAEJA